METISQIKQSLKYTDQYIQLNLMALNKWSSGERGNCPYCQKHRLEKLKYKVQGEGTDSLVSFSKVMLQLYSSNRREMRILSIRELSLTMYVSSRG